MLPEGISFSLSVKVWLQIMASPYPQTGYTIPNYLYYFLQPSYRPPTYPQGCSSPRTLVGASTSSNDVDPNQISWTDTSPRPKFPNRRLPQAKYHQQALIPGRLFLPGAAAPAPELWSVPPNLSPDEISTIDIEDPTISTRLQVPRWPDAETMFNFPQQTPRSHKSPPTNAATQWSIFNQRQGFRSQSHDPPKAVWNIDFWWSSDALIGGFLHHYGWLNVFVFQFLCDLRSPFNAKITATRCSYRLIIVLWLTQRINPRVKCLNTTVFY